MSDASSRLSRTLIVAIVAINALGIGLILPVMPELLEQVGNVEIASAAAVGGFLSVVFAVMQVLFGPLLGALSDRFGRRPVLLLSLFTSGIDYVILATSNDLRLFFVVRVVSGISSATFSVSNATLADLSPPQKRAANFGLTSAAFGIGFVLGPVAGGILGEFGPRAPFVAAAVLCFTAGTLSWLFLSETLTRACRRKLRLSDCIPLAAFVKLRRRMDIVPLLLVYFLDSIAGVVFPAVWAYFAVARFGWTPRMIGISLAAYGLSLAVIQGGLIRVLVARLGEARTALLGLIAGVVTFVTLCTVRSGTTALVLTLPSAFRAITGTAMNGLMSRRVSDAGQGELQGIVGGVAAVSQIVAIPLLTQVFAYANRSDANSAWPGAPFAVSAGFSMIALGLLLFSLLRPAVAVTDFERPVLQNANLIRKEVDHEKRQK